MIDKTFNVGVYSGTIQKDSRDTYIPLLRSFSLGVRKAGLGDRATYLRPNRGFNPKFDVAVIFGSWKDLIREHHIYKNEIISSCKKKEINFICIETPLIGRRMTEDHPFWRIGINHFLYNRARFNNANCDSDRWKKMKRHLRLDVKQWRKNGDHILLPLQLPGDASMRGEDISRWAARTILKLRKHTDRPIWIKAHPIKRKYDFELFNEIIDVSGNVRFIGEEEMSIIQALKNCWACVTYTSGVAVDSIINGVPVIATNDGSFGHPISSTEIEEIESPRMEDRTQWFNNIAYTQWSKKEIRNGDPWKHLKPIIDIYEGSEEDE